MKKYFLFFAATYILSTNIYAKDISVPFINRMVPQEGLNINYSLDGKDPQKLICMFDNFAKGTLQYSENNTEKDGLSFGMDVEVYFTNKGETWARSQGLDNLEQFHVDARGRIVVKEEDRTTTEPARVSCFYLPENSNLKS